MTEKLFAFDERNYHECQSTFRGENNQEYYLGEYSIDGGSKIDVRADKKAVGAYSIIRLQSRTNLSFRRTWSHIREDATDVTVLWFVKRGSLYINHQAGTSLAHAGDFLVTKSMAPFSMECRTDEQDLHEVLHIVVPSHIFRKFVSAEINAGFCTSAKKREFRIAEAMLTEVYDDSEELSERVEHILVDNALAVLAERLKNCEDSLHERQSLSQKRRQDVLRFIEIHLSDPKLSAEMVAQACGISRRYLSHLMRQHGTSFPSLIWDWRLKTAHEWLSSSMADDISISEVAFRIGFKSPAHFSRLFKRVYKVSPREYRNNRLAQRDEMKSDETKPIETKSIKTMSPKYYGAGSSSLQ
ncbi:MAG: helix-turn-helix transcriptional regulator [Pseudomonadota bacterium]|nr:helix-turn-helix transcriptional regulator [Pseudomonadota bacterium]